MSELVECKQCCSVCDGKRRCSFCETMTLYACSDCRIDLRTTVYVCVKCQNRHEEKCPFVLRKKLAEARKEIVRWQNLCGDQAKALTIAKAEMERLSGKTGFCVQCETYAREIERLKIHEHNSSCEGCVKFTSGLYGEIEKLRLTLNQARKKIPLKQILRDAQKDAMD